MFRLKQTWINLRSSFWFLPSLIVVFCMSFAAAIIETDSAGSDRWLAHWPRLFGVGPEGARDMLSTLAGSMMSITGVTFSMTLVALALASSQNTSRILRNFMRSRVTQVTLGVFAGVFAYCLIVLRTIRTGDGVFVPILAVFFAFVLALGGIGVLVFFIHHIASSIQASNIIASIAQETTAAIDRLFAEKWDRGPDRAEAEENDQVLASRDERTWYPVPATLSGYVQSVHSASLLDFARNRKTLVRMERGVGAFVVKDTALASLALAYPPDQEMIDALNEAYRIGRLRTVEQDPSFGIRQLVDMAMKALSPGVNDTSTAVMCIDYLAAILARLACVQFPSSHRYEGGTLRVIAIVPTFGDLLAEAFDQVRDSAEGNVAIMARMLSAIDAIASLTVNPDHIRVLDEQLQWIAELADRTIESTHNRARIEARLTEVRETLEAELALAVGLETA
ncbi:MAG: DUF2254 domain-containing protein [Gammaproteobacteria bacterium]